MGDRGAITELLRRRGAGELRAEQELVALVYAQLHTLAARYLRNERAMHTLSPTALVNEAYLRLADDATFSPDDRREYFAVAARRMRQVLVDHARHHDAGKRGGAGREAVTLSAIAGLASDEGVDTLALDQALVNLENIDPRKVRVVELRYFAGLEMAEIAMLLDVSRATVQRDWEVARAFLFQALA